MRPRHGSAVWGVVLLAGLAAGGCAPGVQRLSPQQRAIAAAAQPILTLDPGAVWTDCYNRLAAFGPAGIAYLAEHPSMTRPAAPDDLRVMVHTSLLRLLAHPATRPKTTVNCLETSLDLLHFDPKVRGHTLGVVLMPVGAPPSTWPDLYPGSFDHALAAEIDVEGDRRALREWWLKYRERPALLAHGQPLRPRAELLWHLLGQRYADRWEYSPQERAVRCSSGVREPVLLWVQSTDYNVVRAACAWLGAADDTAVRRRLIEMVASPAPVVAHNALVALRYAADPRIRKLLEQYKSMDGNEPQRERPQRTSRIVAWWPARGETAAHEDWARECHA